MTTAAFTLNAQRIAFNALGKPFTVRRKPNSTVTGVIASVTFVGLIHNAAAWRVVLRTPTGTFHDPVVVTSLPR